MAGGLLRDIVHWPYHGVFLFSKCRTV